MAAVIPYAKKHPEDKKKANAESWRRREPGPGRAKIGPPGTEVALNRIRIHVTKVHAALRFSESDSQSNIVLHHTDENQYALLGGACTSLAAMPETLMRYLREQLCVRFHSESLERYLMDTLQKRNFGRLVGGGTLYIPVVNERGFVEYTAYVVIDVPNNAIAPLIARSGGMLRVFDGAFYPPFTALGHRDLLIPLLRMRMKVFRSPYFPRDPPPSP